MKLYFWFLFFSFWCVSESLSFINIWKKHCYKHCTCVAIYVSVFMASMCCVITESKNINTLSYFSPDVLCIHMVVVWVYAYANVSECLHLERSQEGHALLRQTHMAIWLYHRVKRRQINKQTNKCSTINKTLSIEKWLYSGKLGGNCKPRWNKSQRRSLWRECLYVFVTHDSWTVLWCLGLQLNYIMVLWMGAPVLR